MYIIAYNLFLYIILLPFLLYNLCHSIIDRRQWQPYLYKWTLKLASIQEGYIWFHGVSAGEVTAIKNLLPYFESEKILITTTSISGYEVAAKLYNRGAKNVVTFFPFDYSFIIKRFLKYYQPKAIVIIETEIWPNLIFCAKQRKIPTFLVSGHLGEISARNYNFLSFIFSPTLKAFTKIFPQSKKDYLRFLKVSRFEKNLSLSGNIKLDLELNISSSINILSHWRGNTIILLASSHKGEDSLILQSYKELKRSHPTIKLVIAPRHIDRVNELAQLCKMYQQNYSLLTSKNKDMNDDILIVNTFGDLIKIYPLIDIAIIGGSFIPGPGGHNPVEPAYFSKPIIIGPYTHNVENIVDGLSSFEGIIKIPEINILANTKFYIQFLIKQEKKRKELGENANKFVNANKGIVKSIARDINDSLT